MTNPPETSAQSTAQSSAPTPPQSSAQTSEGELAATLPPRPALQQRPDRRRDLFNGSGEVQVWGLLGPRALDPFRATLWCELEGNGEVGRHLQEHYPEIVICIAGEGTVVAGGRSYLFKPGVCVPLKLGEILQIKNSLSTPLSYLIIKAEA